MQATIEVLQDPSRAKKFFQKLSRTASPKRSSSEKTEVDRQAAPPSYSNKEVKRGRKEEEKGEDQGPDLKELEKRIEELAKELEKVSQMAHTARNNSFSRSTSLKSPSALSAASRPCPSQDEISFFACKTPLPC